jgi:hypothetical protein
MSPRADFGDTTMHRSTRRSTSASARLLCAAAALALTAACGGSSAASAPSAFSPPTTRDGGSGWLEYVDAAPLDRSSARGVAPGDASAEAAVTHFYASRLRGDERWREVLTSPPSARLERGLAELQSWKFHSFQLVARKERAPGSLWVRVRFEIEVDGDRDEGTDEVGVRLVDGRWRIESVPS